MRTRLGKIAAAATRRVLLTRTRRALARRRRSMHKRRMARLRRDDLRGRIQTVLGTIEPEKLGQTLMHEHLIWDLTRPVMGSIGKPEDDIRLDTLFAVNYGGRRKSATNYRQRERALITDEVRRMVQAGGRGVVELTNGGLKPDPAGLVEIARATGAHIVMGCGWYVDEYQDHHNENRTVEMIARDIVGQVLEGAWDTDVRAGIIGEIGCQNPWTPLERRVMEAALIAQQETGAALTIHPGRRQDQPQEVMEFIRARGGDPSRTIMDHIDRTIFDDDALFRLADTGVVLEWDLFGQESCMYTPNLDVDMPNDAGRLRAIRKVLDRGHRGQVVIAHDICHRAHMSRWGGWGYAHIHRDVLPLMRRRGFSEGEIHEILVETPKRLLTFV